MMTKKHASRGPSKKHRSGTQTRLCWFIIRTTRIYGLWWVYTSNRRGPLRGSSPEIRNCSEIVHKQTLEEPIFRCRGTCPTIEVYFGHMFNPKTKNMSFFPFHCGYPTRGWYFWNVDLGWNWLPSSSSNLGHPDHSGQHRCKRWAPFHGMLQVPGSPISFLKGRRVDASRTDG